MIHSSNLSEILRNMQKGPVVNEDANGAIPAGDPENEPDNDQTQNPDKKKKPQETNPDPDPSTIEIGKVTPVDLAPTTDQPQTTDVDDKKDKKIVEETKSLKGIHFGNYHRSIRKRVIDIIKTNQNLADKHKIRPQGGEMKEETKKKSDIETTPDGHSYSAVAVQKEINKDKRIGKKEAAMIHRLLRGRNEEVVIENTDNKVEEAKLAMPLKGHPYHEKDDAALKFIAKDAHEAAQAMKDHDPKAESKYLDQVNDAHTVMGYRQKGGKRVVNDQEQRKNVDVPGGQGHSIGHFGEEKIEEETKRLYAQSHVHHIVDKLHVSVTDDNITKMMAKRTAGWNNPAQAKLATKDALDRHAANKGLYSHVMSGSFNSSKKKFKDAAATGKAKDFKNEEHINEAGGFDPFSAAGALFGDVLAKLAKGHEKKSPKVSSGKAPTVKVAPKAPVATKTAPKAAPAPAPAPAATTAPAVVAKPRVRVKAGSRPSAAPVQKKPVTVSYKLGKGWKQHDQEFKSPKDAHTWIAGIQKNKEGAGVGMTWRVNEETSLNEVSKKLLGRYVSKAVLDYGMKASNVEKVGDKNSKKAVKRYVGIDKAIGKLGSHYTNVKAT